MLESRININVIVFQCHIKTNYFQLLILKIKQFLKLFVFFTHMHKMYIFIIVIFIN